MSSAVQIINDYVAGSKNSGRPQQVTVDEVWEYLADEEWHTKGEMARHFCVTPETIGNKIRMLREAGLNIFHGINGIRLVNDENICAEDAVDWQKMARWIRGMFDGLVVIAEPMNKPKLIQQLRKALPADKNARRLLRATSVNLTRLIDAAYIESDE